MWISLTNWKTLKNCFQTTAYNSLTEPKNVNEAINNPIWKKSMDEELKAQIDKNTWEMVIPPEGVDIIGSKWTYCLKKNDKNTIIRPTVNHVWLLRVSHKHLELIMMKHMHPSSG